MVDRQRCSTFLLSHKDYNSLSIENSTSQELSARISVS